VTESSTSLKKATRCSVKSVMMICSVFLIQVHFFSLVLFIVCVLYAKAQKNKRSKIKVSTADVQKPLKMTCIGWC